MIANDAYVEAYAKIQENDDIDPESYHILPLLKDNLLLWKDETQ